MYALIRPDRSVRATSPQPFPLDDFPDHTQLPLTGAVPGVPLAAFAAVPEGAVSVVAPYDVEALRVRRIAEDRAEAGRRLAPTDWCVIRAADPTAGTALPAAVVAERQAIRDANAAREAWLTDAARTMADLVALGGCPSWP